MIQFCYVSLPIMSKLVLHKKVFGINIPLPYCIIINDKIIGMTRLPKTQIEMPAGFYKVGVKYLFPLWKWEFSLSSNTTINIKENETLEYEFFHKEQIWNILFDIDLILWIAELFFTLPQPWNTIYKVCSNGFFVIWLIRLFVIRERYFKFKKIELCNNLTN